MNVSNIKKKKVNKFKLRSGRLRSVCFFIPVCDLFQLLLSQKGLFENKVKYSITLASPTSHVYLFWCRRGICGSAKTPNVHIAVDEIWGIRRAQRNERVESRGSNGGNGQSSK